jgi:hypothetical protein
MNDHDGFVRGWIAAAASWFVITGVLKPLQIVGGALEASFARTAPCRLLANTGRGHVSGATASNGVAAGEVAMEVIPIIGIQVR